MEKILENGNLARGVIITLMLTYGGWAATQITDQGNRINQLEKTQGRIETLLLEIKSNNAVAYRETMRRLERIEDRPVR